MVDYSSVTTHTTEVIEMHSSIEVITPQIANLYLQTSAGNRSTKHQHVRLLAQDMKNGKFDITHQGICFNDSGNLIDGHHRMKAIIQAGIPIAMMVTRGLKNSANIDRGQQRTILDCAKMTNQESLWITKSIASVVVYCHNIMKMKTISVAEQIEFAESHKENLIFCASGYRHVKNFSRSPIHAAAFCSVENGVDKKHIDRFFNVLKTGVTEQQGDELVIRLRDRIFNNAISHEFQGRQGAKNLGMLTQRVIKGVSENDPSKKLFTPSDYFYKV